MIIETNIYLFAIQMEEEECSESVPLRNVPLHRQDKGCQQFTIAP